MPKTAESTWASWFPGAQPGFCLQLSPGAAYWFGGRYSVSAVGAAGAVWRGIGSIGSERTFNLGSLNGVCLAKAIPVSSSDSETIKHVIRLEGVDFYMEFGANLPDDQKVFIALFLLQKRLEFGLRSERPAALEFRPTPPHR
jgi:hypothetical protein